MVKAVSRALAEKPSEQIGRGGGEGGIITFCRVGLRFRFGREFSETESNAILDLLGEVEVVTRNVGEQSVDEMKSTQVISGERGHNDATMTSGNQGWALLGRRGLVGFRTFPQ